MPLFQSWDSIRFTFQGRRASLRSALAPGYYIPAPLALKNPTIPQLQLVALKLNLRFTIHDLRVLYQPHNLFFRQHSGCLFCMFVNARDAIFARLNASFLEPVDHV